MFVNSMESKLFDFHCLAGERHARIRVQVGAGYTKNVFQNVQLRSCCELIWHLEYVALFSSDVKNVFFCFTTILSDMIFPSENNSKLFVITWFMKRNVSMYTFVDPWVKCLSETKQGKAQESCFSK